MTPDDAFDPYSAPESELGPDGSVHSPPGDDVDEAPPYSLYSPTQVFAATFFGSLVAGLWLLAENYRALGDDKAFNNTLIGGAVAVVLFIAFAIFVPEDVPTSGISIGISMGALVAAKRLQGDIFENHQMAGGQQQSNWRVAGIALACLIAVLVVIATGVFLFLPGF